MKLAQLEDRRFVGRIDPPMSVDEFEQFCLDNPDLRIERSSEGEIIIMPPAGGESSFQNLEIGSEIRIWAKTSKGRAFDSSCGYILPDGSTFAPDASWVSNQRLNRLPKNERQRFLRTVPELVVEVLSPSDRLAESRRKMKTWMANGVELGWLIHPFKKKVWVYEGNQEPQVLDGPEFLTGTGSLSGLRVDLRSVWQGLS